MVRPWWELMLALLVMAALGSACTWWAKRRDFDRGWEAHAAVTSPAADEPDDDQADDEDGEATAAWLNEMKPPMPLELDDADAALFALAAAAVARAIGMG